jgi:formamidopyrimidine-DNA glycosylase
VPELPEIESLRRDLGKAILGSRIEGGGVIRSDILHVSPGAPEDPLVRGAKICALHRHGKQLVIETDRGSCLLVHLGMSGSLRVHADPDDAETHVHARWRLRKARRTFFLRHRDPRRFGWLESHASIGSVHAEAWRGLGPDALTIRDEDLFSVVRAASRPLKALLLDQSRIAGLGNIYVDEVLFRTGLHPECRARRLGPGSASRLASIIRAVLQEAVRLGGSTIRDHRTAEGGWGSFQKRHGVYGRAGLPCGNCGRLLCSRTVAQRTTVFCPDCQTRTPKEPGGSPLARGGSPGTRGRQQVWKSSLGRRQGP